MDTCRYGVLQRHGDMEAWKREDVEIWRNDMDMDVDMDKAMGMDMVIDMETWK